VAQAATEVSEYTGPDTLVTLMMAGAIICFVTGAVLLVGLIWWLIDHE
jgi:hypothetical protein